MLSIGYFPICFRKPFFLQNYHFFNLSNGLLFFFKTSEIRDSSSDSLDMSSRKNKSYMILVDPYFASKSPGDDVTHVICRQPIEGTKFVLAHTMQN